MVLERLVILVAKVVWPVVLKSRANFYYPGGGVQGGARQVTSQLPCMVQYTLLFEANAQLKATDPSCVSVKDARSRKAPPAQTKRIPASYNWGLQARQVSST